MKKIFLIISFYILLGCEFLEERENMLVQVGESRLTLSKIQEKIPGWDTLSIAQQSDFLKSWVDEELLYQAALQKKIDKKKNLAEKIERARRKIIIDYLVDELTDSITISEKEIEEYYTANPEKFLNGKHRYSVAIISYPSWKLGDLYFRGKKNTPFDKAPTSDYRVKEIENFEMITETPDSCLAKDLRDLPLGTLTGFKVCSKALKSIVVYDYQDSAAVKPLENVLDEAKVLLRFEKRKKIMQDFRAEQKKKIAVFADWDPSVKE